MTDRNPESKKSLFDRASRPAGAATKRKTSLLQLTALALALSSVFAASTWIDIPEVELGSGVEKFPECIKTAVVDFDIAVSDSSTTVEALELSGLGVDCNGKYLRISLLDSNESILGQISSAQLSNVSTLRLSVSPILIDPVNVTGLNLELSESPF